MRARRAAWSCMWMVVAGCSSPKAEAAQPEPRTTGDEETVAEAEALEVAPLAGAEPAAAATMRVHFIDVGQGAATLLEWSCGAILVDTGGEDPNQFASTGALITYLDAFFTERADLNRTLAGLVITHPHIDHTRGVRKLFDEGFTVQNVVTDGLENSSGGAQQRWLHGAGLQRHGYELRRVSLDDVDAEDGLTDAVIDPVACDDVDPDVRVFWGRVPQNPGWSAEEFADANNHSVVLRVVFAEFSIVITGDLEEVAIEELVARSGPELDVDVYEAGHHGSINGTTEGLVDAMSPELSVFEAGPWDRAGRFSASSFGHPRCEVVDMLVAATSRDRDEAASVRCGLRGRRQNDALGANFEERELARAVYSTGWDGTIVVTARASGDVAVSTP